MPAHATEPQQTVGLLVHTLPLAHSSSSDAVSLLSGQYTHNKPNGQAVTLLIS